MEISAWASRCVFLGAPAEVARAPADVGLCGPSQHREARLHRDAHGTVGHPGQTERSPASLLPPSSPQVDEEEKLGSIETCLSRTCMKDCSWLPSLVTDRQA